MKQFIRVAAVLFILCFESMVHQVLIDQVPIDQVLIDQVLIIDV